MVGAATEAGGGAGASLGKAVVLPLQPAMTKNKDVIGAKKINFILIQLSDSVMHLYRLYTASIIRRQAATHCQSKRT
jgi:hypothetical protein